ncbi:hypothetical protein [Shouchella clausii]|uniref:hypothetical protein n=1 Tax=Shouchella clausii TaxID=79880 RepID=UPI000BA60766|nr:hypothetical protein [Shouchella clausii]PAD92295.1 hypothetical protein CHH52_09915 [Shouchella clausii]
MDVYYIRLSLAEIKFDLLSFAYQTATSGFDELEHSGEQLTAIVKKVDQLDEVLERVIRKEEIGKISNE